MDLEKLPSKYEVATHLFSVATRLDSAKMLKKYRKKKASQQRRKQKLKKQKKHRKKKTSQKITHLLLLQQEPFLITSKWWLPKMRQRQLSCCWIRVIFIKQLFTSTLRAGVTLMVIGQLSYFGFPTTLTTQNFAFAFDLLCLWGPWANNQPIHWNIQSACRCCKYQWDKNHHTSNVMGECWCNHDWCCYQESENRRLDTRKTRFNTSSSPSFV